jgi:hypothetical protein
MECRFASKYPLNGKGGGEVIYTHVEWPHTDVHHEITLRFEGKAKTRVSYWGQVLE